jgi:hypothetical protein
MSCRSTPAAVLATQSSKSKQRRFDAVKRLEALSAKGDPLEAIDRLVPWESFRAEIEAVVLRPDELKKSSAGRKPFARELPWLRSTRLPRCPLQATGHVRLDWSHEVVLMGGVTVIVKTRLRGWAYRTRTAESVREPPNWFCVTISPEVGVSPAAETVRARAA